MSESCDSHVRVICESCEGHVRYNVMLVGISQGEKGKPGLRGLPGAPGPAVSTCN